MKTRKLLMGLAFAPLLFTAVPLLPSVSQVQTAQAARLSITGTLVAKPQPTPPTTLFLQVGSQTIPVAITTKTQVERADGSAATLSDLSDGDTLKVNGYPNSQNGITASQIDDLSLLGTLPTATATATASPTMTATATPLPVTLDVTGTLFKLPGQLTAPTILCMAKSQNNGAVLPNISTYSPCDTGVLPVYITSNTQLSRNDGSASALFELRPGDALEVHGSFINAQFTASAVADHSLHETYTQFTGTVQSITLNGAQTNFGVTINSVLSSNSPLPLNATLTLPVANAGGILCAAPSAAQAPCTVVTINGVASPGYNGTGIAQFSVVTAQGLYNSALNTFEYAQWISVAGTVVPTATATSVPSTTMTVKGWLWAAPNPNTAPTMLCVYKAQIGSNAVVPNITTSSLCRSGQLPVYVTTNTVIVRNDGGQIPVSFMHTNNKLEIKGSFVNSQFTASAIRDTSLHNDFQVRFEAKISFISPFTSPAYLVVQTTAKRGGFDPFNKGTNLTVYVQKNTIIYLHGNQTTNDVTVLNPGNMVRIWAYYDRDEHRVSPTMHITLL